METFLLNHVSTREIFFIKLEASEIEAFASKRAITAIKKAEHANMP